MRSLPVGARLCFLHGGDNSAGPTELRQAKHQKQLQAAVVVVSVYCTHAFLFFFMEEILGLKAAPNIMDLWAERKLDCSKTKQTQSQEMFCWLSTCLCIEDVKVNLTKII